MWELVFNFNTFRKKKRPLKPGISKISQFANDGP